MGVWCAFGTKLALTSSQTCRLWSTRGKLLEYVKLPIVCVFRVARYIADCSEYWVLLAYQILVASLDKRCLKLSFFVRVDILLCLNKE